MSCVGSRVSRYKLWLILALAIGAIVQGAPTAVAETRPEIPQPAYLQRRVGFWVKVFSTYSARDFVIHDRDEVWKVYQVLRLPGSGRPSGREIASARAYLKSKYRRALRWLARGRKPVNPAERRAAALLRGAGLSAYHEAAENLHVQEGLRGSFRRGILRSRRYCRTMARIFNAHDLPVELVVLAAVESGFNPHARSSANAVGIWQFIASTGRQYLRINRHHDERLNPVASTRAAALLLSSYHKQLGSWPLAITAYDYGIQGMLRASAAYGGSYRRILENWDGAYFGFAVKNYYSEFLAALRIYEHPRRYFPSLAGRAEPLLLMARAAANEPVDVSSHSAQELRHYRVRRGDTLYRIARRYGLEPARLARMNRVHDAHRLRVGQLLAIPVSYRSRRYAQRHRLHYRVRRGDTLYAIAQRYGLEPARLARMNRVHDAHRLRVGQLLAIPVSYRSRRYAQRHRLHYRVQPGDTLYAIAQHMGVEVKRLMAVNRLDNPRTLAAGSMLVIPAE